MNIRFFGDSWLWTWTSKEEGQGLQSEFLKRHGEKQWGFSTMKSLLKSFGFDVYSYCQPANSLSQTVDIIRNAAKTFGCFDIGDGSNNREVWIIFASSNFRDRPERQPVSWDFSDKGNLLRQLDTTYIDDLVVLNEVMGNSNNIDVIVVGGQAEINPEIFEHIGIPNMHLLSSNIVESLANRYIFYNEDYKKFPSFLFEVNFIQHYDEWIKSHDINSIDKEILDMFEDVEDIRNNDPERYQDIFTAKQLLCWPDTAHLGYNGHVLFLDYLFKFCEDNNIMLQP